jgi:hypothetical protein
MLHIRIQRKRRTRIITKIYGIRTRVNSVNALLNQIAQMPLQIANDSFTNQVFNGISLLLNFSKYCMFCYVLCIYLFL